MIGRKKLWVADPSEKNSLFERPDGLTSCIFFHEWNEWKNMQRVRPSGLEKRLFFSQGSATHSFERQKSFMNFKINVEHECLWFARVLWNQIGLLKAIVVAFILWESTNLSIFGKKSPILWQKITTFLYFWPLKASHALLWPFKGLMRPI